MPVLLRLYGSRSPIRLGLGTLAAAQARMPVLLRLYGSRSPIRLRLGTLAAAQARMPVLLRLYGSRSPIRLGLGTLAAAQARMPVLLEAQHAAIGLLIRAGTGEIVESGFRGLNDVTGDKGSAFARALFGALDAALPFEHGPAIVAVLRKFRENRFEINLAVAERTETARAANPGLKSAINALLAGGTKFGVFYVEHFYSRMIV